MKWNNLQKPFFKANLFQLNAFLCIKLSSFKQRLVHNIRKHLNKGVHILKWDKSKKLQWYLYDFFPNPAKGRAYSRKYGMRATFQKRGKRAKYLTLWAKMCKIWNFFDKGHPHVCDYRTHETARICPTRTPRTSPIISDIFLFSKHWKTDRPNKILIEK